MNKNVGIMLEIQRFWKMIADSKEVVLRQQKSKIFWQKELVDAEKIFNNLSESKKKIALLVKNHELELADIEKKIKISEEKKLSVKSEKEFEAISNELLLLKEKNNTIEDQLLKYLDTEEDNKKNLDIATKTLEEKRIQSKKDLEQIEIKIKSEKIKQKEYNKKIEQLSPELLQEYRVRFLKLLQSKKGIAIAKVERNACTGCNFEIPSSLVLKSKDDKHIAICTNCGRYIYS